MEDSEANVDIHDDPERVPLTDVDSSCSGHAHGCQSHLHGHSHAPLPGQGHVSLLTFTLIANTTLTIVQLVVSIILKSLALFIDAVDMTADVLGYGLNLTVECYGKQPESSPRTRLQLEVVAVTISTSLTLALSIWTIYDASKRLLEDSHHDMDLGLPMLMFALVGLLFNCISLGLFYIHGVPAACTGDEGELNLCSAMLHLMGDTFRMIVIFTSGLYITISGTTKSGMIDAWCAIGVSIVTIALLGPVIYGIVLTIMGLCKHSEPKNCTEDTPVPIKSNYDKLSGGHIDEHG